MILSLILGYGSIILCPALFAAGVAAYFYIPVLGRIIAIALIAAAAAIASYGIGFADRGKLDNSAALQAEVTQLQANLVEEQRQATAARNIADDSSAREVAASAQASDANQKVTDYEMQLDEAEVKAASIPPVAAPSAAIAEVHRAGSCTNPPVKVMSCGLSANDIVSLRGIGAGHSATHAAPTAKRP